MTATTRSRGKPRPFRLEARDADAAIASAERDAVVMWRGQRVPFVDLPELFCQFCGNKLKGLLEYHN